MISLDASYAHCRAVARSRAKNFYYSFVLLEAEQKNAMCAVYAFMRYCDDLSDEPGATQDRDGSMARGLDGGARRDVPIRIRCGRGFWIPCSVIRSRTGISTR